MYSYDENGNMLSMIIRSLLNNEENIIYLHEYDENNRVIKDINPD
jgi:hypothetical protein